MLISKKPKICGKDRLGLMFIAKPVKTKEFSQQVLRNLTDSNRNYY